MPSEIPIRLFDCGHERAEDVRHMLNKKYHYNVPYQKAGEMGYCRICWKMRKIVAIK